MSVFFYMDKHIDIISVNMEIVNTLI